MAILNVTPDSFSDGGALTTVDDVLRHAEQAIRDGATILDIGGESTRPGAGDVPVGEECRRVLPAIQALAKAFPETPLSIDTRKSVVAQAALTAGAVMVNDVSGLQFDSAMAQVVASHQAFLALMHSQGTPGTMQDNPTYNDVAGEVRDFLQQQAQVAIHAGTPRERLLIDPGFGFGKTLAHNWTLFEHLSTFCTLGYPLLLGLSRKSFLTRGDTSMAPAQRDELSVVAMERALGRLPPSLPVIFRVHDVAAHAQVRLSS
jgi:dihydropteroate synthase